MRRLLLLALLLPLALPARAEIATTRSHAVVEEDTIRLADLFDGVGDRGARAVGPAPAPGRRLIIETAQLAGLARAHGLAWRPLSATERVVVERPGRPIAREEVHELLRQELVREGLDPDAELDLPGFSPPMVPLAGTVRLHLEQASYDPTAARLSATLIVAADGMPVVRLRLAGRAIATQPVVVATRRLGVGDIVGPGDLRVTRWRAARVRAGLATAPEQVEGLQLRRPIGPEIAFATADLGAPQVIQRNQAVTILVEAPGLSMSAQGRALEAAARGQTVPVMNLASRAVVEAVATGPGRVRVSFGSAPVARIPDGQTPSAAIAARAAQR